MSENTTPPAIETVDFFGVEIPLALELFIKASPSPLDEEEVKMAKSHAKKKNIAVTLELYARQCKRNQTEAIRLKDVFGDDLRKIGFSLVAELHQDHSKLEAKIQFLTLPLELIIAAHSQAKKMVEDLQSKAKENDQANGKEA